MSLIEHAKREFKALDYIPLDQEQEDGPNKWIQENLIELLEVFSKQGHSGTSAEYCLNLFEKLARFKPLGPLAFRDSEWVNVHDDIYQNSRDSRVFKHGADGRPYFIEAFIKKTQTGSCWHGSLELGDGRYVGRCYIKDPSNMPTIFIDVIETEVANDEWEMVIKDEKQLDNLREFYDLELDQENA